MSIPTRIFQISTQLVFWMSMGLIWAVINQQADAMSLYGLYIAIAVILAYFTRMSESKKSIAAIHIIFIGFLVCIIAVFETRERVISVFLILFMVMSWIAGHKNLDFMDRGHGLQLGFLFLSCFIQYVQEKDTMFPLGLVFLFLFLYLIQLAFERNETYMYFNGKSVIGDRKKVLFHGGFYSVVILAGITMLSLIISMAGTLEPMNRLEREVKSLTHHIVGLIQNPVPKNEWTTEASESVDMDFTEKGSASQPMDPLMQFIGLISVFFLMVAFFSALALYLYRKKKNRPHAELEDIRESIEEEKKLRITKRMLRLSDPSYTERQKIRKIYYRRMKNRGNSDILKSKTPKEHKELKERNQESVNQIFIDIYEKARYNRGIIKREDIKNMQEHK